MLKLYRDDLFELQDPFPALAAAAPSLPRVSASAWRDLVIDRVVHADNAWSRDAERRGAAACHGWLADAARSDLRLLQTVAERAVPEVGPAWGEGPAPQVAHRLAAAPDWAACIEDLAVHHHVHGCGDFSRHAAFRWRDGQLRPIAHPDPVRFADLVGYDDQRAPVIENTERFLRGLPAHDTLLYGDRGTGKSSTVKALLTAFRDRGLRLVEAGRHTFSDFPDIAAAVRGRRQRFILFLDDLSFEESETAFKDLKAVLEGGLEARPDNLLVYATSNRRHLVREGFAERDELRGRDTVEEKLSLADRFGLTVIFPSPDQEAYLAIVDGLCRSRGLDVPRGELRERALRWALWGNGRSGRTARQFVDTLVAEAAVARRPAG
jgi:predicted AAA+ superfamily ATPase